MKDEPKLRRTQGLGHDKTISLKITDEMDQAIAQQADKALVSKSEWIRSQIRNALGGAFSD